MTTRLSILLSLHALASRAAGIAYFVQMMAALALRDVGVVLEDDPWRDAGMWSVGQS